MTRSELASGFFVEELYAEGAEGAESAEGAEKRGGRV